MDEITEQRAHQHKQAHPDQPGTARHQRKLLQRVYNRSGVAHHRLPRHDAAEHDGHAAVEHRARHQGGEDADRQVPLRMLALLGCRRHRVETDVREK
jgi:hypothetical protein